MKKQVIRIATRKSPLALWQANHVKNLLEKAHPSLEVELFGMLTEGDKLLATPLAEIGGKGLFTKELELTLLQKQADIAVHSLKDMPVELPDDFIISAVCKRDTPNDAFVSNNYQSLDDLPLGARVGTSSLRRTCQLRHLRPDLEIESLRGNVGTRLQKLDDDKYDAIILAVAGLTRLNLESRIRSYLSIADMVPAVGQGVIAIECHKDNTNLLSLLQSIEDVPTRLCIDTERAFNYRLGGSCQLPIAAYAELKNETIKLRGLVGSLEGELIKGETEGHVTDNLQLGKNLAEELLKNGAQDILDNLFL